MFKMKYYIETPYYNILQFPNLIEFEKNKYQILNKNSLLEILKNKNIKANDIERLSYWNEDEEAWEEILEETIFNLTQKKNDRKFVFKIKIKFYFRIFQDFSEQNFENKLYFIFENIQEIIYIFSTKFDFIDKSIAYLNHKVSLLEHNTKINFDFNSNEKLNNSDSRNYFSEEKIFSNDFKKKNSFYSSDNINHNNENCNKKKKEELDIKILNSYEDNNYIDHTNEIYSGSKNKNSKKKNKINFSPNFNHKKISNSLKKKNSFSFKQSFISSNQDYSNSKIPSYKNFNSENLILFNNNYNKIQSSRILEANNPELYNLHFSDRKKNEYLNEYENLGISTKNNLEIKQFNKDQILKDFPQQNKLDFPIILNNFHNNQNNLNLSYNNLINIFKSPSVAKKNEQPTLLNQNNSNPNNILKNRSLSSENLLSLSNQPSTNNLNIFDTKSIIDFYYIFSNPIVKEIKSNIKVLQDPIDYESEFTDIYDIFGKSKLKLKAGFEVATFSNFSNIIGCKPKILHISCHGAYIDESGKNKFYLYFEDSIGKLEEMDSEKLFGLLKNSAQEKSHIDLVFISACHSEAIADIFHQVNIPAVICINSHTKVLDIAAQEFSKVFYENLLTGRDLEYSFKQAQNYILAHLDKRSSTEMSCCCFHKHKPNCKWKKDYDMVNSNKEKLHKNHLKNCKCEYAEIHEHEKTCGWALNFLETFSNAENTKNFYDKTKKICCCSPDIPHDESYKFILKIKKDFEIIKKKKFFENNSIGKLEIHNEHNIFNNDISINMRTCLIGRNMDLFSIITHFTGNSTKNNNKLATVFGEEGIGKNSFIQMVGKYMYERKFFQKIIYVNGRRIRIDRRWILTEIFKKLQLDDINYEISTLNDYLECEQIKTLVVINITDKTDSFIGEIKNIILEILEKTRNLKFLVANKSPLFLKEFELEHRLDKLDKRDSAVLLMKLAKEQLKKKEINIFDLETLIKSEIITYSDGNPSIINHIASLLKEKLSKEDLLKIIRNNHDKKKNRSYYLIQIFMVNFDNENKNMYYLILYMLFLVPNGIFVSDLNKIFSNLEINLVFKIFTEFYSDYGIIDKMHYNTDFKDICYFLKQDILKTIEEIKINEEIKFEAYKKLIFLYSSLSRNIVLTLYNNNNLVSIGKEPAFEFSAAQNSGIWFNLPKNRNLDLVYSSSGSNSTQTEFKFSKSMPYNFNLENKNNIKKIESLPNNSVEICYRKEEVLGISHEENFGISLANNFSFISNKKNNSGNDFEIKDSCINFKSLNNSRDISSENFDNYFSDNLKIEENSENNKKSHTIKSDNLNIIPPINNHLNKPEDFSDILHTTSYNFPIKKYFFTKEEINLPIEKYDENIETNIYSLIKSDDFSNSFSYLKKDEDFINAFEDILICIPTILKLIDRKSNCRHLIKEYISLAKKFNLNFSEYRLNLFKLGLYTNFKSDFSLNNLNPKNSNFSQIEKISKEIQNITNFFQGNNYDEGYAEILLLESYIIFDRIFLSEIEYPTFEKNSLEKIYENSQISMKLFEKALNPHGKARVQYFLGKFLLLSDQATIEALINLKDSLDYFSNIQENIIMKIFILIALSVFYLKKKEISESRKCALEARDLAIKTKNNYLIIKTREALENVIKIIRSRSQNVFIFIKSHLYTKKIKATTEVELISDLKEMNKYNLDILGDLEKSISNIGENTNFLYKNNFFKDSNIEILNKYTKEIILPLMPIISQECNFKQILLDKIKKTKKELCVKFEYLNKNSFKDVIESIGKVLHISSDDYNTEGSLIIEGLYGETFKLSQNEIKKIFESAKINENSFNYELIILAIPRSYEIANIFLSYGAAHVIYFDFNEDFLDIVKNLPDKSIFSCINNFSFNFISRIINEKSIQKSFDESVKLLCKDIKKFLISIEKFYFKKDFMKKFESYKNNPNKENLICICNVELLPTETNHDIILSYSCDSFEKFSDSTPVVDISRMRAKLSKGIVRDFPLVGRKKEISEVIKIISNARNLDYLQENIDEGKISEKSEENFDIINIHAECGIGKTVFVKEIGYFFYMRNFFKDGIFYFDIKKIKTLKELKTLFVNNCVFNNNKKDSNNNFVGNPKKKIYEKQKILIILDNTDNIIKNSEKKFFDFLKEKINEKYLTTFILVSINRIKNKIDLIKIHDYELRRFNKVESGYMLLNICLKFKEPEKILELILNEENSPGKNIKKIKDFQKNSEKNNILSIFLASKRLQLCMGLPKEIKSLADKAKKNKLEIIFKDDKSTEKNHNEIFKKIIKKREILKKNNSSKNLFYISKDFSNKNKNNENNIFKIAYDNFIIGNNQEKLKESKDLLEKNLGNLNEKKYALIKHKSNILNFRYNPLCNDNELNPQINRIKYPFIKIQEKNDYEAIFNNPLNNISNFHPLKSEENKIKNSWKKKSTEKNLKNIINPRDIENIKLNNNNINNIQKDISSIVPLDIHKFVEDNVECISYSPNSHNLNDFPYNNVEKQKLNIFKNRKNSECINLKYNKINKFKNIQEENIFIPNSISLSAIPEILSNLSNNNNSIKSDLIYYSNNPRINRFCKSEYICNTTIRGRMKNIQKNLSKNNIKKKNQNQKNLFLSSRKNSNVENENILLQNNYDFSKNFRYIKKNSFNEKTKITGYTNFSDNTFMNKNVKHKKSEDLIFKKRKNSEDFVNHNFITESAPKKEVEEIISFNLKESKVNPKINEKKGINCNPTEISQIGNNSVINLINKEKKYSLFDNNENRPIISGDKKFSLDINNLQKLKNSEGSQNLFPKRELE